VQPVLDALRAQGLQILRLQAVRPSLEDLFIEAVGGMAGGHQAGAALAPRMPETARPPGRGDRP